MSDEIRPIQFDEETDYRFDRGARFVTRAPDLPPLRPFFKPEAMKPMLREWLDELHRTRLMDGIRNICKEKGLDPDKATVRQFLELK